jgi:hypothetical protein
VASTSTRPVPSRTSKPFCFQVVTALKPAPKPAPEPQPRPAPLDSDGGQEDAFDPDDPNLPTAIAVRRKENWLGDRRQLSRFDLQLVGHLDRDPGRPRQPGITERPAFLSRSRWPTS